MWQIVETAFALLVLAVILGIIVIIGKAVFRILDL